MLAGLYARAPDRAPAPRAPPHPEPKEKIKSVISNGPLVPVHVTLATGGEQDL
jgi:hypothetical protein